LCGISVLYNQKPQDDSDIYLKHRGPDKRNELLINDFHMIHYLLAITGGFTTQPIVDRDKNIVCLFNGEIYNYKDFGDFNSDVYAIIESYKQYGDDFVKKLDGEFALFLIDFNKKFFYLSTDVFGIKPIYYSLDHGFGMSSYQSFLLKNGYTNVTRIEPNTTLKFDFDFKIIKEFYVYQFMLDQYKNTYNDWISAFMASVKKRFKSVQYDIVLPLSSGHDSAAIACAMNILNVDYVSYSFLKNEDEKIIKDRININNNEFVINSESVKQDVIRKIVHEKCEKFYYGHDYDSKFYMGFDDPGAMGLATLLKEVKQSHPHLKILASGQGSDEVMSNVQMYKFRNPNPAKFTDDLNGLFPWDNFYKGAQSSYLGKEECISGSFGIEGRYPFLDKKVVQEYLSLKPELKNKYFKAPLTHFLKINNYPVSFEKCDPEVNIKKGFNPV
jgi:asparagine synthetase B (glutamine-hydrolysing)